MCDIPEGTVGSRGLLLENPLEAAGQRLVQAPDLAEHSTNR
jgi:hypothetical protein